MYFELVLGHNLFVSCVPGCWVFRKGIMCSESFFLDMWDYYEAQQDEQSSHEDWCKTQRTSRYFHITNRHMV